MKNLIQLIITIVTYCIVSVGLCFLIPELYPESSTTTQETIEYQEPKPKTTPPYDFDYSWVKDNQYIAHALGGLGEGYVYTNSYEAFQYSYTLGYRIFEADLLKLSDGTIVGVHDTESWSQKTGIDFLDHEVTGEEFLGALTYGKFHTVSAALLVDLLAEYPDAYLITDIKYLEDPQVFYDTLSSFVSIAKEKNPSILNRIIPQIYESNQLEEVLKIYPFNSVIYTLYRTEWTPESVVEFTQKTGVGLIVLWDDAYTDNIKAIWDSENFYISTHTVDDDTQANQSFSRGVDLIFTNHLKPTYSE